MEFSEFIENININEQKEDIIINERTEEIINRKIIYEWKIIKNIIHDLVNLGATIFGGALRDIILHNLHAQKFYKLQSENKDLIYSNINHSPETLGRLVIPKDIDFIIHETKLKRIIDYLSSKYYISKIKEGDCHEYIDSNIQPNTLYMYKYKILHFSYEDTIIIDLDIIVSKISLEHKQPTPPFTKPDFICNCLILNKEKGISISKKYFDYNIITPNFHFEKIIILNKIINSIDNKVAIIDEYCNPPFYRINKMFNKGWKIESVFKEIKIIEKNEEEENICVICHEEQKEGDKYVNFNCNSGLCKGYYCLKCCFQLCKNYDTNYIENREQSKCPYCRENLSLNIINEGIKVYYTNSSLLTNEKSNL